ncbi:TIGR02281 family clan AA aspartic protease [Rhizobium sp. TRM95111]|uniref:TIGR02281 family clan AA aspartic protease n=1 Tax=Rhizobium alarense TaxID=2846851 RepID=UPI001F414DED|nr:TIGR02281 family clan AA aspartic protease [Rhizobium alarense]MCF3639897.1 TIGR02281 family clan AA aspartic protease [Rhizobium alarense]
MRLLVLLAILGLGLVMLVLNHDDGRTFGLANDDFGRLVMLSSLVALFGAGMLASRRRFGESLRQAAIWLVIILALVAVYLYRTDLQSFASRMTAGLIPGRAIVTTAADGSRMLVVHRMEGGHFAADVAVDGVSLRMLVDTGASTVVLSHDDALRIGIDAEALTYSIPVMTANGRTMAAPVTLRQVAIGPIVRDNIRAMVAQDGNLDESLLGMSFLGTLGSLEMAGDELRLRD